MKTLFALVADRFENTEDKEILWDDEITRSLALRRGPSESGRDGTGLRWRSGWFS